MLAIMMMCHKNAQQINRFLKALKHDKIRFFIHVDKKSNIDKEIINREDVYLIPEKERVSVKWARYSQVEATLKLLKVAIEWEEAQYFMLCSGQDFPIKSAEYILQFLEEGKENEYINLFHSRNNPENASGKSGLNYDKRNELYFPQWMIGKGFAQRLIKRIYIEITGGYALTYRICKRKNKINMNYYFGSQWWCLSRRFCTWMEKYLAEHSEYASFFKNTVCPDECFFQTLFMSSPYVGKKTDNLHFVNWKEDKNSPEIFLNEDFGSLVESPKLMARKFDTTIDFEILSRLEEVLMNDR